MSIRAANSNDASRIAEIHIKSWKWAYADIMSQATLDHLCIQQRTDMWGKILKENIKHVKVYEKPSHGIVGWIVYGPSRDVHDEKNIGEIEAFYIDPMYCRCGYGQLLYQNALSELKQQGYIKIYLWVLAENTNAITFYKKVGMIQDHHAKKAFSIDHKLLEESKFYIHI